MTRASWIAILFALAAGLPAWAAQPDSTAAPVDSTAAPALEPPVPTTIESKPRKVTSKLERPAEERDRFEIGAGVVQGFFDGVGSLGYRRLLGQGPVFESSLMLEVTGTRKDQLTQGAVAGYVLLRPWKTYKESWRLRPLIEAGPGVHTVVQTASLEGLEKSRYKAHVYVKTHGYLGFEALFSRRFGIVARGRVSIPSHRPLDYAQAAILLR